MLNWVLQGKDTSFALSLITNVGILLAHANHHTLMPWATHDGWEYGTRSIISGETGLAHSGSIVNNERSNFFVTHFDLCKFFFWCKKKKN
uniref:Putative conserved secreted protein n=1 Tax=Nyssomyia neivai TaxID=330878 RepID=A0A1L8DNN2_9DIPT